MNHTAFSYEPHVRYVIDRIAEDRDVTSPFPAGAPGLVERTRARIGSVLITIGERVGGPAVRAPRPATPRPSHEPLLSF